MAFRKTIRGKLSTNYYVERYIPSRTDPNHVAVRRSTRTPDKDEAERIEAQWVADAEEEYIKKTEGVGHPDDVLLSDAAFYMMEEQWNTDRPFRQISECIRLIGDVPLSAFSGSAGGKLIRELRDKLLGTRALLPNDRSRGKIRNKTTVNRYMAALKALLNTHKKERGLDDLVVPAFKMFQESGGRTRTLKDHEERLMFETASKLDPKFADFLRILLDTGARVTEALLVNVYSDVDIKRKTIRMRTIKRKGGLIKFRTLPLTQRCLRILSKYKQSDQDAPFQDWDNTRVSKLFALVAIKMDLSLAADGKNARFAEDKEFVPHMLRHTCITRLLTNGVPPTVVQSWVDHASFSTTEIYCNHVPDHLLIGAEALDNYNS